MYFASRIGFLGLGLMGSGIVSNLLKMGHVVTVWNRTAEKVLALSHRQHYYYFHSLVLTLHMYDV